MKNQFFAFLSRMKYIGRWGLMRNTRQENIREHSASVAVLAHALGVINNVRFGGNADPDKLASVALYHDAEEIITGDMPTPVKYFSPDLRAAVAEAEADAKNTLLRMLPADLRPAYRGLLYCEDEQTKRLVKAADVLDAHIKCIEEVKSGNAEFAAARESTGRKLRALACPEADYFIEQFLPAFEKNLDEQQKIDPSEKGENL